MQGSTLEYGTLAESLAIMAQQKRDRIEMLRTIAIVTATVNPEKAQEALHRLIEETFPAVGRDRKKSVDKAMEIMEKEKEKVYVVSKVGAPLKKSVGARLQGILRKRRPRPGGSR